MQIVSGLRVDSHKLATVRYYDGVCTGRVRTDRFPVGVARAEVVWTTNRVRWPLVSILTPAIQ